jgi:hypothetical protein
MSTPTQGTMLAGGGGEKGGSGEDPTRPKLLAGVDPVVARLDQQIVTTGQDQIEGREGNWDGAAMEELNAGPEAGLTGEVDLEDEFCMEEEEEQETPSTTPTVWRLLARYYSIKAANYTLIHNHFSDVWRIRKKMVFKPLKDNFFIITFTSEGDYKFVAEGGPWIHQGTACLIAPFVNNAQPS